MGKSVEQQENFTGSIPLEFSCTFGSVTRSISSRDISGDISREMSGDISGWSSSSGQAVRGSSLLLPVASPTPLSESRASDPRTFAESGSTSGEDG